MTYRDEKAGLELRVRDLEAELVEARETIERMKGARPVAAERDDVDTWTGAPTNLVLTRELPFEITERGYEAIGEMLRSRFPGVPISQIGRRLHVSLPFAELRLERTEAGHTRLRAMRAPVGIRAGSIVLAFVLAIVGAIPVAAGFKGVGLSPAYFVASLPLVLLAAILGARALVRRGQGGEKDRLIGAFESMAAIAKEHAISAGTPSPNVRFATGAAPGSADAAAEAEAEAEGGGAVEPARATPTRG